jgi:hypothetical protein
VNTKTYCLLILALERAVKTGAQVAGALLFVGHTLNLASAPWRDAIAAGVMAALLSAVTTLATAGAPRLPAWAVPSYKALVTGVQSLLAVGAAGRWGLLDASWRSVVVTALSAVVASMLTSLGSIPIGPPGTSLVKAAA